MAAPAPQDAEELAPGAHLGPYVIVERLGAGGMGVVYRARDERLGRDVALKLVPPGLRSPDRLRRFAIEARATAALSHPNVLAVFDVATEGPHPYLVTELLEGDSLSALLETGPLPPRRALVLAAQAARGLAAAHQRGILHRDLKPSNLFVTRDGVLKILDFGLAKVVEPSASGMSDTVDAAATPADRTDGSPVGTVGFMAPEQLQGRPADARTDLFAFGCVLYQMLSGQRAFEGPTPVDISYKILHHDAPPLPQTVDPAVVRIVARCLAKEPAERFQSARDLAFVLGDLANTSRSSASGLGLGEATMRVPKAGPSRRWALAAVALVGIGVGAGGALLVRGRRPASVPVAAVAPAVAPPARFLRVTYRTGTIASARFTSQRDAMVFSADFDNGPRVYLADRNTPEQRPLTDPGVVLASVSSRGELALLTGAHVSSHGIDFEGTLARMPLTGGTPRPIVENVTGADFSPDGKTLAAIHMEGGHERIEYPLGHVLYQSAGSCTDIRVSPDGRSVAFVEHNSGVEPSGQVMVVGPDGKPRKVGAFFSGIAHGLVWLSDEAVLVTAGTSSARRDLLVLHLDGRVETVYPSPRDVVIYDRAPDGAMLIGAGDQRKPLFASRSGWAAPREVTPFESAWLIGLTRDGGSFLFGFVPEGQAPTFSVARTDGGAPPTLLGTGWAQALSPEGKWVVAARDTDLNTLEIVPTGIGQPHALLRGPIAEYDRVTFLPGDRGVIFSGHVADRPSRLWAQPLDGGEPRPITDEKQTVSRQDAPIVSVDGREVAFKDDAGVTLRMPIGGGPTSKVPGIDPADELLTWTSDARALVVRRGLPRSPARLARIELATGAATVVAELEPPKVRGVNAVYAFISADGKTTVSQANLARFDLYLAEPKTDLKPATK